MNAINRDNTRCQLFIIVIENCPFSSACPFIPSIVRLSCIRGIVTFLGKRGVKVDQHEMKPPSLFFLDQNVEIAWYNTTHTCFFFFLHFFIVALKERETR
jgi:hypothetical protein